jgi:hypothetical protein
VRDVNTLLELRSLDESMDALTSQLHAGPLQENVGNHVVSAVDTMVAASRVLAELMRSMIRRRLSAQLYLLAMVYTDC